MSYWENGYIPEESSHMEAGNYRVKVVDVDETKSQKSGLPMIVITVQPNGSKMLIKHYIVRNDYFNRNITQFFDSFGIERGDFCFDGWIGAMGGAKLAEDDRGYLKVKWFLSQRQCENLPEWQGEKPERQTVGKLDEPRFEDIKPNDDLPF